MTEFATAINDLEVWNVCGYVYIRCLGAMHGVDPQAEISMLREAIGTAKAVISAELKSPALASYARRQAVMLHTVSFKPDHCNVFMIWNSSLVHVIVYCCTCLYCSHRCWCISAFIRSISSDRFSVCTLNIFPGLFFQALLSSTTDRLQQVQRMMKQFTSTHKDLTALGFRVQFVFEKTQVAMHEAMEYLTILRAPGEDPQGGRAVICYFTYFTVAWERYALAVSLLFVMRPFRKLTISKSAHLLYIFVSSS